MSDPVAEKSGFLKMYMSSHPDTLVGYAKWYGKVTERMTGAEMSAIDTKSMTLTCTLKTGAKKVVIVRIDPPLAGYDDVKPRLLEMKAISQEGLGMLILAQIKSPQIKTFHFPPRGIDVAIFFSILSFGAFAPTEGESGLVAVTQIMHSYLSQKTFMILWAGTLGIHFVESLYTLYLCRKHRASFAVTSMYISATWLIGFRLWKDLRKRIQDARIASVMKVE